MRKTILVVALMALVSFGGCRGIWGIGAKIPVISAPFVFGLGEWVDGSVFNIYTGNGHYDGEARWNNFTANWQQIQNFVDIHVWNYDIRDPYVGAPYFGDPR